MYMGSAPTVQTHRWTYEEKAFESEDWEALFSAVNKGGVVVNPYASDESFSHG